ncbi:MULTISPECIES: hypothetical protein [unclassified Streptomyces]|uniref:hypothetical protein n=2 Tax=Streptomyces TaxID=1883 RepID=UPI000382C0E5|nr:MULTISPECIES: hypothetical protein [unclassified Streptomyces]MYX31707.1 hypothetical protein [Streptomyces sp. SID8381]
MNFKHRLGVIAAGSAALLGIAAVSPASAATMSAAAVHRGSVGCFNYSWGDGSVTYTIYYHNTCSVKSAIAGTTTALFNNKWCANVAAGGKGHTVVYNKPMTFTSAKGGHC